MKKLLGWLNKNKTYAYTVGIAVVAFMFMLNALFTIQLKLENAELNEEIFELENRMKSAKQENQKLQTDIYIEQEATERLSMVKSSEMPIKVIEYEEKLKEEEALKDQEEKDKTYIFLTEWYKGLEEAIIKEEKPEEVQENKEVKKEEVKEEKKETEVKVEKEKTE